MISILSCKYLPKQLNL